MEIKRTAIPGLLPLLILVLPRAKELQHNQVSDAKAAQWM
jgi:hypothetical protein